MKTYSLRLFPTTIQIDQLHKLSTVRNNLWNTLLKIEQNEYETNGKIVHNYELDKRITILRKNPEVSILSSKTCQYISKEIFTSYKIFWTLIKKDKTARPPKFIENINNFHSIIYNQSGWIFKNNKIYINKIPFEFKSKEDYSKLKIRQVTVKFKNNKWLCDLCIDEPIIYKNTITQDNKILAIDLGLKNLGNCIDNTGEYIVIRNKAKKISKYYLKRIAKIQSKQSKCTKFSKRFKKLQKVKSNLFSKKNSQVKQTLHIQSNNILNMNYHTIVVGDLSVKKLMELEKNKNSKVSKSFGMTNINMFLELLKYKSYDYQTNIVKINEQYTTQTNSLTGKQFLNKVELSDRTVKLSNDIEIDRDLNASINILERYFNNHLALATKPLDKTNVIHKFNLMNKPACMGEVVVI